jgi:hypothetical protein
MNNSSVEHMGPYPTAPYAPAPVNISRDDIRSFAIENDLKGVPASDLEKLEQKLRKAQNQRTSHMMGIMAKMTTLGGIQAEIVSLKGPAAAEKAKPQDERNMKIIKELEFKNGDLDHKCDEISKLSARQAALDHSIYILTSAVNAMESIKEQKEFNVAPTTLDQIEENLAKCARASQASLSSYMFIEGTSANFAADVKEDNAGAGARGRRGVFGPECENHHNSWRRASPLYHVLQFFPVSSNSFPTLQQSPLSDHGRDCGNSSTLYSFDIHVRGRRHTCRAIQAFHSADLVSLSPLTCTPSCPSAQFPPSRVRQREAIVS